MAWLGKIKAYISSKTSLAWKLSGLVALTVLLVYIPIIFIGVLSDLNQVKEELEDYKQSLELRIQSSFEPAIWNYDIDTLKKLLSMELNNKNLSSIKISTGERTLIWLSSRDGQIQEAYFEPTGPYIDKRVIPITRFDEREQIIAYATVWYDHRESRNLLVKEIGVNILNTGVILLIVALAVNYSTYLKLVQPLESIRKSMIEGGKSSPALARKQMSEANFKAAFVEILHMAADLEHMFQEIDAAYAKIKASENLFRAIFLQAGVGVAQINFEDGRFLLVNQCFCDIVGYTEEELRQKTCRDITFQDDLELQCEKMQELLSGNKQSLSFEKRFVSKEGKVVWAEVTITPLWSEGEEPTTQIMVVQDITAKKAAEQEIIKLNDELEAKVLARTNELEEANCELEATIDALKTAQSQLVIHEKMAVLGQLVSGIAHELNTPLGVINSAGGILEKTIREEIKWVIDFCTTAPDMAVKLYERLTERGRAHTDDMSSQTKREIKRRYYTALKEHQAEVPAEVVEHLVEMGYDAETQDFLALFNIPQAPQAIRAAYVMSVLQRTTQMVRISAEKASKVIMALKIYGHNETHGQLVPHDVIKDIELVLTLYYNQTKYGVEIERRYEEVPPVLCYPDKLHQVWVNIINNALQAMNNKGKLIIAVAKMEDKVRVSITDNGPGIPESIMDRIFEPFFTTKKLGEGTGLGLDIVKRVVNEIGGEISVESRKGETTFHILLNT
jgi:PAS domain S-box-containing protein